MRQPQGNTGWSGRRGVGRESRAYAAISMWGTFCPRLSPLSPAVLAGAGVEALQHLPPLDNRY